MQIEEYRTRLELFEEALNREHYLHYSGQKESLETRGLYSDYSDLFGLETIQEIKDEIAKVPGFLESRTKNLYKLLAFAVDQHLDQIACSISEEIAEFESKSTVAWDGRDICFNQIPLRLANERDATRRRQLDEIRTKALEGSNYMRKERVAKLQSEVRLLGYTSYLQAYQSNTGIDYRGLSSCLDRLLEATEGDYVSSLSDSVQHRLGLTLSEAQHCDIGFWNRMNEYDVFFRKEQMLSVLYGTLRSIGIDPEKQSNVSLDLADRPHKYPRAFCAPLRIPQEIKMVLLLRGGQDDYSALLHESGHAQHFAWTSPSLPPEHRYCGDRGLSETFAFLFENLMLDETWLLNLVGISRTRDFLRFYTLMRTHLIRRYCGKLRYEVWLHGNNGQDAPDWSYAEILGQLTGFSYKRESYLEDLDDGFYTADYLRAWIFEPQLRDYLRTKFGHTWFQNKSAGKFLRELWETGQLYSIDELSREIGMGPPDPQALTDELCQGLRL